MELRPSSTAKAMLEMELMPSTASKRIALERMPASSTSRIGHRVVRIVPIVESLPELCDHKQASEQVSRPNVSEKIRDTSSTAKALTWTAERLVSLVDLCHLFL